MKFARCQRVLLVIVILTSGASVAQFQPPIPVKYPPVPSLRKQAEILDDWTKKRIDHIPELMKRNGVDVWLVSGNSCKMIVNDKWFRVSLSKDEPLVFLLFYYYIYLFI